MSARKSIGGVVGIVFYALAALLFVYFISACVYVTNDLKTQLTTFQDVKDNLFIIARLYFEYAVKPLIYALILGALGLLARLHLPEKAPGLTVAVDTATADDEENASSAYYETADEPEETGEAEEIEDAATMIDREDAE